MIDLGEQPTEMIRMKNSIRVKGGFIQRTALALCICLLAIPAMAFAKDSNGRPYYVKTENLNNGSSGSTISPVLNNYDDQDYDFDVNCYIGMPGNGVLAQGGEVWQNSMVINVDVDNVDEIINAFPNTEPIWSIKQTSGQTLQIDTWTQSWPHARYFRGELTEIPDQTGDSTFEITCTWGGTTTTETITIHCVDIDWPTGLVNIQDTIHTYIGAKLSFNPEIVPDGWEVPGYPQLRWGFDDEADTFALTVPTKKDESRDQYLDINDRKDLRIIADGTYESTYVITSDRISVGRLVTFVIDKSPDWTFVLPADIKTIDANAFEGIAAESVYIPEGCTSIESDAFANSDISVIFIPTSVTEIGNNALPKDVFIYTPENSPAAIWAKGKGFEDYQIVNPDQ